jgi:hypothetical protein
VTEEQRRQAPARKQPSGLPIFAAAAALLVGRRYIKDILPPRAWQHRQTSGNAPLPHFVIGSKSAPNRENGVLRTKKPGYQTGSWPKIAIFCIELVRNNMG